MKRTIIPERWEKIIDMVEEQGSATVEQIAQSLSISAATVRRDLARIHQRGLISRTRGGASPSQRISIGPTLAESRKINPYEKEMIGRVAAQLAEPGDTLMIDGGYTTSQVASYLDAANITVVTNSLDVAQAVTARKDAKLVIVGGELSVVSGTTVGPITEQQILQMNANKAILGADAISVEEGVSSPNPSTAQTKRAMIRCSREVIIVADYSKLGEAALYKVASIDAISTLVTDDKADEDMLKAFRAAGVEVIVASDSDILSSDEQIN